MQLINTQTVNTTTDQAQNQLVLLKKSIGAEMNFFGTLVNSSGALEVFLSFEGSLEKGISSENFILRRSN